MKRSIIRRKWFWLSLAVIFTGFFSLPTQRSIGQASNLRPVVVQAERFDLSPALRSLDNPKVDAPETLSELQEPGTGTHRLPKTEVSRNSEVEEDPVLQPVAPLDPSTMPGPRLNFPGIPSRNGVIPPDPNGDIGPDHYVQWINLSLQIWSIDRANQTATSVYGPVNGNVLWAGFGGECELSNDGDPIVLYDHLADRWLAGQFALGATNTGPFHQCLAVSQTPDPTGSWYRYSFLISHSKLNDYPKLAVWPDGYYMTINQYLGDNWAGAGVAVFEREKMLAGLPANMVLFDLYTVNPDFGGMLPSDLDGPPPPPGSPNYFMEVDDSSWIGPADAARVWEFRVNWNNPSASTFGLGGQPNQTLNVANFNPLCMATRSCIPQPSPGARLDAIGDRLMHRLQYRNYGGYATLVTNHTVDAGSGRAGVRWYELRLAEGSWAIYQQGTYAGEDTSEHRWMASAALDNAGNMAVGYSVSSSGTYPSIRYSGRLASDPLGSLPQGEATLFVGSGAQKDWSRWGDYSMLAVDPLDDCTFWYTNQYYLTNSTGDFKTRIGSFVFPNCLSVAKGSLAGQVTEAGSGLPLEGVKIQIGALTTFTDSAGEYLLPGIGIGAYTVTASLYGYANQVVNNVLINTNQQTLVDFSLQALPFETVEGKVMDGSAQEWPLYARLQINAEGFAQTIFSTPGSGNFSIQLPQGVEHTFLVTAVLPGYLPLETQVTPAPGGSIYNINLVIDQVSCSAPGYSFSGDDCLPLPGGLLAGNIYDGNTSLGINGAQVGSDAAPGTTTTSFATPEDAQVADGLYILFSPLTGQQSFSAQKEAYRPATGQVSVQPAQVANLDFVLAAGYLQVDPVQLDVQLPITGTFTTTIRLDNLGQAPLAFQVNEVNGAIFSNLAGPFAQPGRHTSPKALDDLDSQRVYSYQPPEAPLLPGRQVLSSWPSGLVRPWGIGIDPRSSELWVGNALTGGGDGFVHRYTAAGELLAGKIPVSPAGAVFGADLAYDPFRQLFWQVNVGGDNCLEAFDPVLLVRTGDRICPPLANSARGLAFNPLDGSFYAGSWNDSVLYHFNANGQLLDSVATGLNIAGLAYHPTSQHLYVLSNANVGRDVYLLHSRNDYQVLGGFDIPGLEDYGGAGLDLDCAGNLWLVDQYAGNVLQVTSGEGSSCDWQEIDWLQVDPTSGTLPASSTGQLLLTFDATTAPLGVHYLKLVLVNDTPYGHVEIPLVVHKGRSLYLPLVPRNGG